VVTKIKICGVRTLDAARAVIEAGADFAGLNFVPSSRRRVGSEDAQQISALLRGSDTKSVGVFMDQDVEEIAAIASALELDFVQLHGAEPPASCAALAARFKVIKAIAAGGALDTEVALAAYAEHVELFLFDSPKPGSGTVFSWSDLAARKIPRPYLLAGGINAENVAGAIATLHPFGVDTASGVEREGAIDRERVKLFIEEARRA
jgi:phosphoribosylanthranilate isomerase